LRNAEKTLMIRSGRQIKFVFVQTVSSFRFSTKGERRRVEGEEGERESKFGILVWLSKETFNARVLRKGTDTTIAS